MLKTGNIYENYIEDPIDRELRLNNNHYIFSAEVSITFDNNNYNYLSDNELRDTLSADLSMINENLKISDIVVRASKKDGWPIVKVQNISPMTLSEFVTIINTIFLKELDVKTTLTKYSKIFTIIEHK